jgi:hypothetical protein
MAADACRPVRVRHREGESVVVVDELDDAQARLGRTQFVEQRRPLRVVDGRIDSSELLPVLTCCLT